MLVDTDPTVPPRRRWPDDPPLRDTGEFPPAPEPVDPGKGNFLKDMALRFLPPLAAGILSLVLVILVTQKDVGVLTEGVNSLKLSAASQAVNNIAIATRLTVVETNQVLFLEFKAALEELSNLKAALAAQGASMSALAKSMDDFALELRELRREK